MSGCERLLIKFHNRSRKRGPRSFDSITKRSLRKKNQCFFGSESRLFYASEPPGGDPCKSGFLPPALFNAFIFLHHNVRGFLNNKSELEILLDVYQNPTVIVLTDTYLDPSIKKPTLIGYDIVGRRDRGNLRQKGGIIVFARKDVCRYIVHVGNSDNAEKNLGCYSY